MLPIVTVPRLWPGATVICLGSGPSLVPGDVDALASRGRQRQPHYVIAVNDAYRLAPWADVLYAPDARWWGWHGAGASSFPGRKYTLDDSEAAAAAGAERLNYRSGGGLSDDPTTIMTGGHAGYQAINVAVHLGAARIILLGYDLQPEEATGRHHYFGDHPDGSHVPYDEWRDIYQTLLKPLARRNITIVNASRATAIVAIPRQPLADVLMSL